MTINKSMENDKLTVNVQGRLDTATAPELEQALQESMADANELVVDLEGLEYMSSAGLRILLASHKAMSAKRGMKVINVNDIIAELFEITGFSDILDIE